MIHAVEALGLRWRIAFTSSSLSGIQGAVADGIGISLLPRRAVTRDHRIIDGDRAAGDRQLRDRPVAPRGR